MSRIAAIAWMMLCSCAAQELVESGRAVARKAAAALSPAEPVRVSVRNLSELPATQFEAARQAIAGEFRGRAEGQDTVQVTLAESVSGYLWVAEILRGGKREAVFLEPAGAPSAAAVVDRRVPLATLEKRLVWEQDEPILDVAVVAGDLAVLTPAGVLFPGARRTLAITPARPWPRDLRGRVVVEGDLVRAWLPGMACAGQAALECRPSDDAWPGAPPQAAIAAGRNHFGGGGAPAFFSAARAGDTWVFDGRADWGGDIASLESACAAAPLVLATKPSGADEPDAVQAFEIRDRQAVAASPPAAFPGPVTALWQAEEKTSAIAVSRNLETGRYEAFRLSVTCGR